MENQPTTLDKVVKVSIIAGALIVSLSMAYYVGIFLPKKEATRIGEKRRAETKQLRDDCLAEVEKNYLVDTKKRDEALAVAKKEGYLLPVSKLFDKNGARQECFNKYPQ